MFQQHDDVLSLWGLAGLERATLSGSGEPSRCRAHTQLPPYWQNRRIIPDDLRERTRRNGEFLCRRKQSAFLVVYGLDDH